MTVGYTSGVFDLLHQGHINYLSSCNKYCQSLIVGVDIDSIVKSKKGIGRPIEDAEIRLKNVFNTGIVDIVFLKDKGLLEILPIIRPSVYFKPDNRTLESYKTDYCSQNGIQVIDIPYYHGVSTTQILNKA